jgi:hypothetical protein
MEIKQNQKHAIIPILLGLLFILFSVISHSIKLIDTESLFLIEAGKVTFEIIGHVGIGFLLLGFLSILLDMEHWTNYFETRLKSIVIDKKYLESLDKDSLINLQVEVLKAYFHNDSIAGTGGFLRYYQKSIQSIIGSAYRVNASMFINVDYDKNPNLFFISESMSYTCKSNSGKIQEEIVYIPDEHEHHKSIFYEVIIQSEELKNFENCKKVFTDEKLKEGKIPNGFKIDISEYNYNNLLVTIRAEYLIEKNRFFAWRMSHPTRNISLTVKYPNKFRLERESFIHDKNNILEEDNKTHGIYNLNTNSWLMPDEGFTFQLMENTLSSSIE